MKSKGSPIGRRTLADMPYECHGHNSSLHVQILCTLQCKYCVDATVYDMMLSNM